jgi:hypothetical protein
MWQALIGPVSGLLDTVLRRVLPPEKMSEAERAHLESELKLAVMQFDWQSILGQLEINKEEAKHENVFVAGWRPFIGWTCGSAFAYNFVLQPFLVFAVTVIEKDLPPLPTLEMSALVSVVVGMLGLGGMRTFEKWTGTNRGEGDHGKRIQG